MATVDEQKMLHRMSAYCSSGERCIQDVEKKLLAAGMSQEESEKIIAYLVDEKFIDERRYARCFVNDKVRFNVWGRYRIGYELKLKGLPPEVINEAVANIDTSTSVKVLFDLLKTKKKSMKEKDNRVIYLKLFRFAQGRGFEKVEISQCLHNLFDGYNGDDAIE